MRGYGIVLAVLGVLAGCGSDPGNNGQSEGTAGASGASTAGNKGGAGGTGGVSQGNNGGNGGTPECGYLNLKLGQPGPYGTTLFYEAPDLSVLGFYQGFFYLSQSGKLGKLSAEGGAAEELGTAPEKAKMLTDGRLLWSEKQSGTETSRILVAALNELASPTVVAEDVPTWFSQSADENALYLEIREPAAILKLPLSGGGPIELVPGGRPNGMISHNGHLYWLDHNTEHLERIPTSGGERERLTKMFFGGQMAADGNDIYWTDFSLHTVNRWTIGQTSSSVLHRNSDDFARPGGIQVIDKTLYWTEGELCTGLYRARTDGTDLQLVTQGMELGSILAITDKYIFLSGSESILRVSR